MDNEIELECGFYPNVVLRSIQQADQSHLKDWKNQNRSGFFYKEIITEEGQLKWFQGYLSRPDDYMFIIQVSNTDIGCMGFRLLEEGWDIYNVILGNTDFGRKGYMSQAFKMMCSYIQSLKSVRISAKVLKTNPALDWYCRNGFRIAETFDDYEEIELNPDQFQPCPVVITNSTNQ
jgi:RimJ/RimL family protein N-acetyltransferase